MWGKMPPAHVSTVLPGNPLKSPHPGDFVPSWCYRSPPHEFWVKRFVVAMSNLLHEMGNQQE